MAQLTPTNIQPPALKRAAPFVAQNQVLQGERGTQWLNLVFSTRELTAGNISQKVLSGSDQYSHVKHGQGNALISFLRNLLENKIPAHFCKFCPIHPLNTIMSTGYVDVCFCNNLQ